MLVMQVAPARESNLVTPPSHPGTMPGLSDFTGANITVTTDKSWYKNNSVVIVSGMLQVQGVKENHTIAVEIYFHGEATPTYTTFAITTSTGSYSKSFLHGHGKEGRFDVYVGVVGEPTPVNSTYYRYDEHPPVVGTVTPLPAYTNQNRTISWTVASDNNVTADNLTYSVYRFRGTVGTVPQPQDYTIPSGAGSLKVLSWVDADATSNRDYYYKVSVRDLAGNAANYTVVKTTYDRTPPSVTITSPSQGGSYANTLTVSALISDSIPFTAWAHVWNASGYNSSSIPLLYQSGNNLTGAVYSQNWIIPAELSGPYNITVFAMDALGNLNIRAGPRFSITKQAPVFITITDNTPSYTETGNVLTRIIEIDNTNGNDVDTVFLDYSTDNVIFTRVSMAFVNGTTLDGYWQGTIPQRSYYLYPGGPRTRVYYRIWANNSYYGNVNVSSTRFYDVEDRTKPDFTVAIQNPSTVQFFQTVSISINVTEHVNASGVSFTLGDVLLEYRNGTGAWTNITLANLGGNRYNAFFQSFQENQKIPAFNFGNHIYYRVWAKDLRGNWNVSRTHDYIVQDNDAPRLVNAGLFKSPVNYNETGRVYANFTDVYSTISRLSSGINFSSVKIRYSTDNWGTMREASMTFLYGNIYNNSWQYTFSTFKHNTVVRYRFVLSDYVGNPLVSSEFSFTIVDQYVPTFAGLQYPSNPTYRDLINVSLVPSEPVNASGIDYLRLIFTNASGQQAPLTMVNASGTFYALIPKQNWGQSITVVIEIFDKATPANKRTVTGISIPIGDVQNPQFVVDPILNDADGFIQYHERINVTARARDLTPGDALPSGMKNVTMEYRVNGGAPTRLLMTLVSGTIYNGTWNVVLNYFNYNDNISCTVFLYDNAGNVNSFLMPTINIKDNLAPTFNVPIVINAPVEYHEASNISVRAIEPRTPADASGVANVYLHYTINGVPGQTACARHSGTIYDGHWAAIIPARDYGTNITYYFRITDRAGLVSSTLTYSFLVRDFVQPAITSVYHDEDATNYYQDVTISVNATEALVPAASSGIASVMLNYSIAGVSFNSQPMTLSSGGAFAGTWVAVIPKADYNRMVVYNVTVVDNAGNVRVSSNYWYVVDDNVLPSIGTPVVQDTNNQDSFLEYYEGIQISAFLSKDREPTRSSALASVTLNYTTGTTWITLSMSKVSGDPENFFGTWNHIFPANSFSWNMSISFYVIATDNAGNVNVSAMQSFHVTDKQRPDISNLRVENPVPRYNQRVNMTVHITEPANAAGVANATIQYSTDGGVIWLDIPAGRLNGTIFSGTWSALLPFLNYGTSVQVRCLAFDRAGNSRFSGIVAFIITDLIAPVVMSLQYDTFNEYWEDNLVRLTVTEPQTPARASGVANVYLNYSINGVPQARLTLVLQQGDVFNGNWTCTIPKQPYGTTVAFFYTVRDGAGNQVISSTYQYTVQDAIDPVISSLILDDNNNHDGIIQYYERAVVRVSVQEVASPTTSSGIVSVDIARSIDGGEWTQDLMVLQGGDGVFSGLYNFTFPFLDWGTNVRYKIIALDGAGNQVETSEQEFTVRDNIQPTVNVPTVENAPVMYYELPSIVVNVVEPTSPAKASGINFIQVNYTYTNWMTHAVVLMTLRSGDIYTGNWNATLPASPYGTVVQYRIRAHDRAGQLRVSSTYSFTVGDDLAPAVTAHVTSGVYQYYTNVTINATVVEPASASGVSLVTLVYSVNGVLQAPVSMTRISGDLFNGIWTATITTKPYGSLIQFNFTARDVATNTVTGARNSLYTVLDDRDPVLGAITVTGGGDADVEYFEQAEVTIELSEETVPAASSGVQLVILEYTTNAWVSSTNLTMSIKTGNAWAGTWNVFLPLLPWNASVVFKVHVRDAAGNQVESSVQSFTIKDFQDIIMGVPVVDGAPVQYKDQVNISVSLQEPATASGVASAMLNYSYYGNVWFVVPMVLVAGDARSGTWRVELPQYHAYQTLFKYTVLANDTAGNMKTSPLYQFVVQDLVNPVINSIVLTDNGDGLMPVQYSERGIVKINVSEALLPNRSSGIEIVRVFYEINTNPGVWIAATTVRESFITLHYKEVWNGTILRQHYGVVVRYYVTATDKAGRTTTSAMYNYTVDDTTNPTFGTISHANTNYHQNATISAVVNEVTTPTNSSGVAIVRALVSIDGGSSWSVHPMTRILGTIHAGTYTVSLPRFSYGTVVRYRVNATDSAGNTGQSTQFQYTVGDNIKPAFGAFNVSVVTPNYDQPQVIDVNILEAFNASGIDPTRVTLYIQNATSTYSIPMSRSAGDNTIPYLNTWWRATIPATHRYGQVVSYWVVAYDIAGNFNTSAVRTYNIIDVYPVSLISDPVVINAPVEYSTPAEIRLNASEPFLASGINFIRLRWRNDTSGWQNVSMANIEGDEYVGNVPAVHAYGTTIEWHVLLVDIAGNVRNHSSTTSFVIVDTSAPVFTSISTEPEQVIANVEIVIFATFSELPLASGLNTSLGSAKIHFNITGPSPESDIQSMSWNATRQAFYYTMRAATVEETVSFFFEVYDMAGNGVNTTIFTYEPGDEIAPDIYAVTFPPVIQYHQQLNVNVSVFDAGSGAKSVFVHYKIGVAGTWTEASATRIAGDAYNGTWRAVLPRQAFGSQIYFYARAVDGVGNQTVEDNGAAYFLCVVTDTVLPTVDTIRVNGSLPSAANIQYFQDANVTARVYKSLFPALAAQITQVILNYSIIPGAWVQVNMVRVSGTQNDGTWAAIIPAEIAYNTKVNFTIYAVDQNANNRSTAQSTYTIKDFRSPVYSAFVVTGEYYYEIVTVSIRVARDVNASSIVSVSLTFVVDGVPDSKLMTLLDGSNVNGTWGTTIGPFDYGKVVSISVNCLDQAGNAFSSPATKPAFMIDDNVDPNVYFISNPGDVYYYDPVTITTSISEVGVSPKSSGIVQASVHLNFSTNGGASWTSIAMAVSGTFNAYNSSFSAVIPEHDYGTEVLFIIIVSDVAGNVVIMPGAGYIVGDDVSPVVSNFDKVKATIYYHEQAIVRANLSESVSPRLASGVKNATLHYRVGSTWFQVPMTPVSGSQFSGTWEAAIPALSHGTVVTYNVSAHDFAGNFVQAGFSRSYTVGDDRAPTYSPAIYLLDTNNMDGNIEYNETAAIRVRVFEDFNNPTNASSVATVTLNYSVNYGAWTTIQRTAPMNGSRFDGWWNFTLAPRAYNSFVRFTFIIRDNANNVNVSVMFTYTVTDSYAPVLATPVASTPVYHNANSTISVQVSERSNDVVSYAASGVASVVVNYSVSGGPVVSIPAQIVAGQGDNFNGLWRVTLPAFDWNATIRYNVTARDNAGNVRWSANHQFIVRDQVAPVIGTPVVMNAPIQYYENAVIAVNVSEPLSGFGTLPAGVSTVRYYYSVGGAFKGFLPLVLDAGTKYAGTWVVSLPLFNYSSVITGYIWADDFDALGSPAISANFSFSIFDDVAPSINSISLNATVVTYEYDVEILVNVLDGAGQPTRSSGVDASTGVVLYYQIGTNPEQPGALLRVAGTAFNGTYRFVVPKQPYGRVITFRVFAEDDAANSVFSGYQAYVVNDTVAPVIGTPSDNAPMYDQLPVFQVTVQEPASASGVSYVTLRYLVNGVPASPVNATLISGTQFSGTWRVEVSRFNFNDFVSYNLTAVDVEGNEQVSVTRNFTVGDLTRPVLSNLVIVNAPVSYNVHPEIRVRAVEQVSIEGTLPSGIDALWINYTVLGVSNVLPLTFVSGSMLNGTWTVTIPQYFSWNSLVSFTIFANDTAGNVRTLASSFTIVDGDAPVFSGLQARNQLGLALYAYNDTITISATISEAPAFNTSSGIDYATVVLYYRFNGTGTWFSRSMSRQAGDIYQSLWSTTLGPRKYNNLVEYFIHVADNAGNARNSSSGSYLVSDYWAPMWSNPRINGNTPGSQPVYYNTPLTFSITVAEDLLASGVHSVLLNHSINGTAFVTVGLTLVSGTLYSGTWSFTRAAMNFGSTMNYSFIVQDLASMRRSTPHYTFVVGDNVRPTLSAISYIGDPIEYYENLEVRIVAYEETSPARSSGLHQASIRYTTDGITFLTGSMTDVSGNAFNRTYRFIFPVKYPWNTVVSFTINVTDLVGNFRTATGLYTIKDVTAPVITSVQLRDNNDEDGVFEFNEVLSVRVNATEALNASAINQVMLNYSVNGLPYTSVFMTRVAGTNFAGTWNHVLGTFQYGTLLAYNVTVVDNAGNRVSSSPFTIVVADRSKPLFSTPRVNNGTLVTYFNEIQYVVNVSKTLTSAPINNVTIVYSINGAPTVEANATKVVVYVAGYFEQWRFVMPRQNAFTNITYFFRAYDVAGNVNQTIVRPVQVVDRQAPQLVEITMNGEPNVASWEVAYNQTLMVTTRFRETDGITNGSGVDKVFLSFRSTSVNFTTVQMPRIIGNMHDGTYQFTIPALAWSGTVHVRIEARDKTGLELNYYIGLFSVVQTDPTPPAISGVTVLQESAFPGYFDINEPSSFYTVMINATITTPVNSSGLKLSGTMVQFRAIGSSTWINATMIPTGVPNVYRAFVYGMAWNQNIEYRVRAQNNFGAVAINATHPGGAYTYKAVDRKAPVRVADTIGVIEQDSSVEVSITLYEPVNASGINPSSVVVRYKHPSISWQQSLLSNDGTGKYEGIITGFPAGTVVTYHFYFADLVGNALYFPATNYSYTIGDSKLPVYNETATLQNAPSSVKYMTAMNFSVYCYDDDSSISSITISYTVGLGTEQLLSSYVKVPGATKQQDRYVFTIPGQAWVHGVIVIYIVNITDSSANTLHLSGTSQRKYITIVDPDKPLLDNQSIIVSNAFQDLNRTNPVRIDFTVSEPIGSSGLLNVSLVYTNSSGAWRTITVMNPGTSSFTIFIPEQKPFTVVTYHFVVSDKAGNVLNTAASSRSFKLDYLEHRNVNDTSLTPLEDPVEGTPLLSFTFDPAVNVSVRVTEFDDNPYSVGPRFTYHTIVGKVYKMTLNRSSAFINEGQIEFHFNASLLDAAAIDVSKLVLARYTPLGYTPLASYVLDLDNNRIVFNDTYELQNFLFTLASGYTEYLVLLGEYKVPVPQVISPVLVDGMNLYGTVIFTIQTQTFAQNVSAYYKVGFGGSYILIGENVSSGTSFTIPWNTTSLGNLNNILFKFEARNPQGFAGVREDLFFVHVHNVPDPPFSTLSLPSGAFFTGDVLLTATSTIPASSATFFYYTATDPTPVIIGTNSTMGFSWDGLYPFTGTSVFTFTWDTSPLGNVDTVYFGVNLTSFHVPTDVGTTIAGPRNLRNVPDPVISFPVSFPGQIIYGVQQVTVTCTIPGSVATFYYIVAAQPPTFIGTNVSVGNNLTFIFNWDTTSIPRIMDDLVQFMVVVTSKAGLNGSSNFPTVFRIRNVPEILAGSLSPGSGSLVGIVSFSVIVEKEPYPTHANFTVYLQGIDLVNIGVDYEPEIVVIESKEYFKFEVFWDTRYYAEMFITWDVSIHNVISYVATSSLVFCFPGLSNVPTPTFQSIGPYAPGALSGKSLNETVLITVTTPVYASNVEFNFQYFSNNTLVTLEGDLSHDVDNKTFWFSWATFLAPNDIVRISVTMYNLGGYSRTTTTDFFTVFNVDRPVKFESVSTVQPGIISGSSVLVRVNSTRFAENVSLFCVLDGVQHPIGFGFLTHGGGDYYHVTFTWDSLNFSKWVLANVNPAWYSFNVQLVAFADNGTIWNATITSVQYTVQNAPEFTSDLPALLHGSVTVGVMNVIDFIDLVSVFAWFYNGPAPVNLTLSAVGPGAYSTLHDFSPYVPNASATFTIGALTTGGIWYVQALPAVMINNTPVPVFVEDFQVAGHPGVVSGNVTFHVTSVVTFTRAEFSVLLSNGTSLPITVVDFGGERRLLADALFASLDFTRDGGLPDDILGVRFVVRMFNHLGEWAEQVTGIYDIFNAPAVVLTCPDVVSGEVVLVATNTRPYINETGASITVWNGVAFVTHVMGDHDPVNKNFSLAWDSRLVSNNLTFGITVTMNSSTGTSATTTRVIAIDNGAGHDFITFLPAGVRVTFNLTTSWFRARGLNMIGEIIATQDGYLRIFNGTLPVVAAPAGYFLFDRTRAFNITVLDVSGTGTVPFTMNITFVYDFVLFNNFPARELNETTVAMLKYQGGSSFTTMHGVLNATAKTIRFTGLTSLSVFVFAAREMSQVSPVEEGPDLLSFLVILGIIVGIVSGVAVKAKPKTVKEQIVPGKKKTCKQCGKYVKPYAVSCPYCGYKLTDEETMADAMNKLRHLFIFHEDSGVCLYYHPFTASTIDPQLISGFLSAITSFGGQFDDATAKKKDKDVQKAKATSDLKELVYKEYRILMETSGACKFAVLITGTTSKILSFKISQFIKHFMRTYDDVLKDWKGNVRLFKDVEKMVRLIFGLTKVKAEGGDKLGAGGEDDEKPSPASGKGPKGPPPAGAPAQPAPPQPPRAPGGMNPAGQPSPGQAGDVKPASSSLFAMKEKLGPLPGEPGNARRPSPPPHEDDKDKKKKKR